MSQAIDTDVIVLGGGAAGLMCAAVAGARGRRVHVLEKTRRVGKKILMSGGGRCNFTNLYSGSDNFLSANPHYCKSALARYTPDDFIGLVETHGIAWHEKERGQLFCDGSSRQIVRLLLDECERVGVTVHTEIDIREVRDAGCSGFRVATGAGTWTGEAVVVATGGLSIPKMGASGLGFDLARDFGLAVREPGPALVPFTLGADEHKPFADLTGLGLDVEASCNQASFEAGMLFTHRGLSGPAMLQVSSYWQAGEPVSVDWLPGVDTGAWLTDRRAARPNARLSTVLAERLPKRLAACLCRDAGAARLGDSRLKAWSNDELAALDARLADWRFMPAATEGYRTAEVTIGGVDTDELLSSSMAARAVPGLYFIGEVVDVTGHLGGHNFQWAWASANAAGQVV